MHVGTVARIWIEGLKNDGYERECKSLIEYKKLSSSLFQVWHLIFKKTGLKIGEEIFELGCGGGKHLMPLALRGYKMTGLDCSLEVLQRCQKFINSVKKYHINSLDITLVHCDFLFYTSAKKYGMVFSNGVLEHFMQDSERISVLKRCYEIVKPSGWCVTVVPSGIHPKRGIIKKGLGGYEIPEIDYSPKQLQYELKLAGFSETEVIPWNLFGYFPIIFNKGLLHLFAFLVVIIFRVIPRCLLSMQFQQRHAYSLVALSKK